MNANLIAIMPLKSRIPVSFDINILMTSIVTLSHQYRLYNSLPPKTLFLYVKIDTFIILLWSLFRIMCLNMQYFEVVPNVPRSVNL